jgi:hypothetical protein
MRFFRLLAYMFGSLPLFCGAQQPAAGPASEAGRLDRLTGSLEENLAEEEASGFGEFRQGGAGFRLADTEFGTMNFSAWAYTRYLNQKSLGNGTVFMTSLEMVF